MKNKHVLDEFDGVIESDALNMRYLGGIHTQESFRYAPPVDWVLSRTFYADIITQCSFLEHVEQQMLIISHCGLQLYLLAERI